ncbi:unnamed protein product [Tuber aestivum]|uniref:NB-ARC domain-containing protein n=1 Tax=Tuber aestivum TaxID=59557 RepID=A0A292Q9S1_9PEZI|nr:unnamed protein product [Tuber aestivum]
MDRMADISGNFSGNSGDHNVYGSNYNNNNIITGNSSSITNIGPIYQGCAFRTGDREAYRPYRIIPYCRNSKFTGRKHLIEAVKRNSQGSGHRRIALHGLGGSGKTQIALEYVYQRASESDCDVFWVHGSGVPEFSEGFRAIAQHVRIPVASAKTDQEGFLLNVKRWFEGPASGDWILVIDNADNEEDFIGNGGRISKFVPQGQRGTLIFTTRSLRVVSWQNCERIEVGKMEEDEAQALFSKRLGNWNTTGDEEKEAITMILESVHHIPLAIVGAAAFMSETQTLPSTYWKIFRGSDEQARRLLSQPFCDIQREADMTESILATYFVTFDRITLQMPRAAELLRLITFLDRQNIPEELLSQSGLEGADDPIEFRQAIGKLLGFSLVTTVKCGDKTFYELHRLVQLSLQVYLPTDELNRWRATALGVVSSLFPRHWNSWRDVSSAYIPHVLVVTKHSTDPIAEELCFRLGQYFQDMGFYNDAEIQLCRCITLREESREYDWDAEGRSRVMLLGAVSIYQGKADVAEKILRNLLEDIEGSLGPDTPIVLKAMDWLALALRFRGKYDESEAMSRCALEGREKIGGPEHPDTVTGISNLAIVLQDQGKYDESETMNRRALEAGERILGPDHPDTLASVSNLALILHSQGKYDESETMNRRGLEGREKILGPDHPDTLASVNNLGMALQGQGKYDEAETMKRRALEGYEKILEPDHPLTLTSTHNLASVLRCRGKYIESETMYRRALEGFEKLLGPDHRDTLLALNNLAFALQDQGKYIESETMIRRALEGNEKILGPDHPHTLAIAKTLASVLQDQGKYIESETINRHALKRLERILGRDHPHTLSSVNNLASVLQDQGKYIESETMYRCALEGLEKILGRDHPHTLSSVNNLASVLRNLGKFAESETMHRRALEGHEKILGPDHPHTLISVSNLALVSHYQGKYIESETMNQRVLKVRRMILGRDRPRTSSSANSLATLPRLQG